MFFTPIFLDVPNPRINAFYSTTLLVTSNYNLNDKEMFLPTSVIRSTPPPLRYLEHENNFHNKCNSCGCSSLGGGELAFVMASRFMDRI